MGRETIRYIDRERELAEKYRMHPVWRGVGCLMVVFLGFVGYYASGWLLEANAVNQWVYLPPELLSPSFASWLPQGAFIRIAVGLIVVMLGYGVLNIIYAIIFPVKLGETDEPPLSSMDQRKL